MEDKNNIVIDNPEDAREVIQRRINAYEHFVEKASSLLQLIIASLSVVAALAAAGLLTEFMSLFITLRDPGQITVLEALPSAISLFAILMIMLLSGIYAIRYLLRIILENDYPGIVLPDRATDGSRIGELGENNIKYEDWLIEYACGTENNVSIVSNVQKWYQIAVYSGMVAAGALFHSILFISYLLEANSFVVVCLNASIIIFFMALLVLRMEKVRQGTLSSESETAVDVLLVILGIAALFSGIAVIGFAVEWVPRALEYLLAAI